MNRQSSYLNTEFRKIFFTTFLMIDAYAFRNLIFTGFDCYKESTFVGRKET